MQAEFLGEQTAGIGNHAEDADAARQRGGVGENLIGAAGHVIAARGSHAAHRNHYGLLGFEEFHGVPDLLGGIGAAAARVDAYHHGLHVFVLCQFVEVLYERAAHYLIVAAHERSRSGLVHNVAVGVVHGDFIALVLAAAGGNHVGGAYEMEFLLLGERAQFGACAVDIGERVDQFVSHEIFRFGKADVVVGQFFHALGRKFAVGSSVGAHRVPDVVDVRGDLLAVGGTHFGLREGFHRTLVRADAEHLHLHADFLEHLLEKHGLGCKSVPVHHARGVEHHGIGRGGKVVARLRIGVGIGGDKLARLLKVEQRLVELFERGKVRGERAAVEVDAADVLVVLGQFDGFQGFVKAERWVCGVAHKFVERIGLGGAFFHCGIERDAQHAAFVDGGACLASAGGNHGCQHHEAHECEEGEHAERAEHRREEHFEKLFHS